MVTFSHYQEATLLCPLHFSLRLRNCRIDHAGDRPSWSGKTEGQRGRGLGRPSSDRGGERERDAVVGFKSEATHSSAATSTVDYSILLILVFPSSHSLVKAFFFKARYPSSLVLSSLCVAVSNCGRLPSAGKSNPSPLNIPDPSCCRRYTVSTVHCLRVAAERHFPLSRAHCGYRSVVLA